jgi:hypothetical protein
MFRVLVEQRLVTRDACGTLTRELELPFAPFPGLDLDGISLSDDALRIEEVAWDVKRGLFLVCSSTWRSTTAGWRLCGASWARAGPSPPTNPRPGRAARTGDAGGEHGRPGPCRDWCTCREWARRW